MNQMVIKLDHQESIHLMEFILPNREFVMSDEANAFLKKLYHSMREQWNLIP